MKKSAVLLPLLLLIIVVACGGVSATKVERELYDKLDKGDVAGALALTADDAVFDIPGCPEGGCKGKEAVKGAFEGAVAQHTRHTIKSSKDSKNTATSQVEDELDLAKAAGVQRVVLKVTVELKGDKIARFQAQFDTSDQQTATVVNFRRLSTIYRRYEDTLNQGDVAAALALWTEDGEFGGAGLCPATKPCVGKEAIQKQFERGVAAKRRFDIKSLQVSGNAVTGHGEFRSNIVTQAGVERTIVKFTATFKDDKISRLAVEDDRAEPQTATFLNFGRLSRILRQHIDAINRDDVAGGLAALTDDAEYVRGVRCTPANPCKGKERIQRDALEFDVRFNNRYNITEVQVSGDTVNARVEFRGLPTRDAGIERAIVLFTATFKGDRISRFVGANDTTDAQTAVLANFGRIARVALLPTDGVNRGDVAFAVAAFADDASFAGYGLCAPTPCVGKAAIQKEMERQVADKTSTTLILGTVRVSGNTQTGRWEIRSDSIKAAGVERVIVTRTTEVPRDKITVLRWQLDTTDPQTATYLKVAILRQHYEALNKGDVAATVASFTDDAEVVRGACSPLKPCKGKAEIQRQVEREVGNKIQLTVLSLQVAGDTVIARIEFRGIPVQNVGIERVIFTHKVTFKGDKISRFEAKRDDSDTQSAQFANFERVAAVTTGWQTALNRGEVAGVMAFFADDAVFEGLGLCAAVKCVGKAAIQKEIERQVADKTKLTGVVPTTARVSGDVISGGRTEIRSDSIKAAGVERIIVLASTEVKGAKITSTRLAPDPSDQQTAKYSARVLLHPVAYEVWVIDQADAAKGGAKLYIYKKSQVEGERSGGSPEVVDLNAAATGVGDGPGVRPHLIDFNKDHTYAVVANVASGHVYFMRASDRKIVASIDVGEQAHGAVVSPDGALVLAANQNGKKLARIKADFEKGVFTYNKAEDLDLKALEDAGHPDNAPICPILFPQGGKKAYVTVRGGGLYIIDTSATPMKVVKSFTKDEVAPAGCGGLAVGKKVYINSGTATSSNLYVFDSDTDSLKKSLDLSSVGKDGHGMVLVGNGRYLWMGQRASHNIAVIDTQTDTQVGVITGFGNAPDIMDASPKGDLVFVALRGPNNLTGGPPAKGQTPGMVVLQIKDIGASAAQASFLAIGDQSAGSPVDPHVLAVRIVGGDLASILRQHVDALNRGDVAGLMAAFTDDAVVDGRTTQCQANPCVGNAAIKRAMEIQVGVKVSYNIIDVQVSGDTATLRSDQRGEGVTGAGVERVIFTATVTFRGDKISRWVHKQDASDPQTATFINFQRVTGAHNRQITALARGDVGAVMVNFADDAVYEGLGLCASAPCVGKAAIQKEMERQAADKTSFTILPFQALSRVSGDNMTRPRIEVGSDSIKAAGIERIIASATAEVKGSKITSLRYALDATDPQTATYLKSQAK